MAHKNTGWPGKESTGVYFFLYKKLEATRGVFSGMSLTCFWYSLPQDIAVVDAKSLPGFKEILDKSM